MTTKKLDLGDILAMGRALDEKNVPTKDRIVRLGLGQFYDLCKAQGVTCDSFKTRMLDDDIVEVYL